MDSGTRSSVLGSRQLCELVEAISPTLGEGEARELVAAYFDKPRHWATINASEPVAAPDWQGALGAAAKRAAGAPLQYAVGKANFRNLTLAVDQRVLIPRPETELLVDLVLRHAPCGGTAIDVGTGSGAIAISLALEGRFDRVVATDISQDALEVARENAVRSGAVIEFEHADLLAFARREQRFTAVVSNPPYVTFEEAKRLPASVRDWEPPAALYSGRDGLDHTARLVAQAASMLQDEGLLALEVDARRASLVAELVAADDRYARVTVELDLTGRERFVLAVRRTRS